MTLLSLIGAFLSGSWNLLVETTIPGTGFSYAALFVGLVVISIGFKFLSYVLGFGFGGLDANASGLRRNEYRAGKARQAKISSARLHDEK